jgi:hypothetical protein
MRKKRHNQKREIMKRFLVFVTLLALLGAACNKKQDTTTTSSTSTTSFPYKASEYIVNNYPDASVDYVMTVSSSQARYIAVLNTTEELAFTQDGEFLGDGREFHHGDSIPGDTTHCDTLPGWHHGHGHHPHPPHPGPGGWNGYGIPPDSLPAAIVSYITNIFAGAHICHANFDSICPDGQVIAVMVGTPGVEPMKLFFESSGSYSFLYKGNRFRYNDMPQAVKNYIATNLAGYMISPKGEKFTMADNTLQYRVYLHLQQDRKIVRLSEDGTLVCMQ